MAQRDDSGEYAPRVSDNEILKVFDRADAPFLTSGEVADDLPISRSAVNHRLNGMHEKNLVDRKQTGARSVGWWATVAPRLSEEARQQADAADPENAISLAQLEAEFESSGE